MTCKKDWYIRQYCSEDISRIENYDKAMADKEHRWDCHHRAEILPCGRYTVDQLQKHGLYWKRPASELIFIRHDEHIRLHRIGSHDSHETRSKRSKSLINNTVKSKGVCMTRLSDALQMKFPSQSEAARWLRENGYPNATQGAISNCCMGKIRSIYGASWSYAH